MAKTIKELHSALANVVTSMAGKNNTAAKSVYRDSKTINLLFCGVTPDKGKTQWAVVGGNKSLADTLNGWFKPKLIAEVKKEESFLLSTASIRRPGLQRGHFLQPHARPSGLPQELRPPCSR